MMKKIIILLILLAICGNLNAYPFFGMGISYGHTSWQLILLSFDIGYRIFDWTSFNLEFGTLGFGNKIRIDNRFYLFDILFASHDFSCFFIGLKPFLSYNIGAGFNIPIYKKQVLAFSFTWAIWDYLIIDTLDSTYSITMKEYPTSRWNISLFYEFPMFPNDVGAK